MERPWLILCRVLHVDPPGDDDVQADAEDNAAVGGAEADAQAQDEQHDGVGEAEENVAAVDEAAGAQAQHDAVGEAGEEEEQHAGVDEAGEQVAAVDAAVEAQDDEAAVGDEAEVDPQAQLEESVLNVNTDAAAAEAAHAVHGADEPDFTITVAPPPWVSFLAAGPGSHPSPEQPDMYPYIVATGRFCLLVHFAIAPNYGTHFDQQPTDSYLVVVRHFRRADDGQIEAIAVRVPDRPDDDDDLPALRNIESVGLACHQATGNYVIAELIVATGAQDEAAVMHIRTETGVWQGNYYANPLLAENRGEREWVPHGTASINSTVLWYDLSWGIISCDLDDPDLLKFHRLPPGRVLRAGAGAMADHHGSRCVAVSENLLRYVEIILNPPPQAATVNMWYRDLEADPLLWRLNYSESFADIWANESYAQTELPMNPPMLVGVSPVNSNVVYFSLNQRLFGVNAPEHTVVDCEEYEPLNRPGLLDDAPVTSRYLITWNLDADQAPNIGHQPDEPSDHGDSSDGGSMDEGDIDYEPPPE